MSHGRSAVAPIANMGQRKSSSVLQDVSEDEEEVPPYSVHVNQPEWPAERIRMSYKNNYISTTKYSVLTFLPLNLFHQFSRFYNLYFLLSAVLSLAFAEASPISPFLTVFPLVLVLTVTAIKDMYEDYMRYRSDRKANNIPCSIANHGGPLRRSRCADIRPGDIVEVRKDESFPADLLLLASSNAEGGALIQTAQLDGETNLKRRKAVYDNELTSDEIARLLQWQATVECEEPNENLYKFEGRLRAGEDRQLIPLRPANLLLRGAMLRNTERVLAIAIYVGKDTKVMRNLRQTRIKFSSLERRVNLVVMAVFILNLVIWFLSLLFSGLWQDNYGMMSWYIDWPQSGLYVAGYHFVTYFVLWTYLIPLSLFVSIELVRVAQMLFMDWDEQMRSQIDGEPVPMSCNNSNLNEDLGRIEHIFSDKTGTLTQNLMNLRAWYMDGTVYQESTSSASPSTQGAGMDRFRNGGCLGRTVRRAQEEPSKMSKGTVARLRLFLRAVGLCNTVVPSSPAATAASAADRSVVYEADSPDELALLEAARSNGLELRERSQATITFSLDVTVFDKLRGNESSEFDTRASGPKQAEERWSILQVLEFSSDRKRMSVIAQLLDDDGKASGPLYLITKGADSVMLPLVRGNPANSPETLQAAQAAIDEFARQALRTLVFGYRQVEQSEFEAFMVAYQQADQAIGGRAEKVADVAATIERNLVFLGCSAVEDKLQDECAETIRYLTNANIHFWLLTGDKKETAIAVGVQSGLLTDPSAVLHLSGDTLGSVGQNLYTLSQKVTPDEKRVLVVEGSTLYYVLDTVWSDAFLELAESVPSVICCRVTPLQKALVVQLVKTKLNRICLSIGDGANDVSMIEMAHIGVGIEGKEGSQAVRASDYSFVEFRFLRRLIAVHGRYSYLRMRQLILYSFYKNIAFIMVVFWWGFWSAWSGQSIYNDSIMATFNVIYSSLPPLAQGIFEKDISEHAIDREPRLYHEVQRGIYFNRETFVAWTLSAFYHCFIIYFGIFISINPESTPLDFRGLQAPVSDGRWVGGPAHMRLESRTMSLYYSSAALSVVLLKSLLTTRQVMWVNAAALGLSLAVYIGTVFALGISLPYGGSDIAMFTSPVFYFAFVLTIVASLGPDVAVTYLARQERPRDWQVLQEVDVLLQKQWGDNGETETGEAAKPRLQRKASTIQEKEPINRRRTPAGYGALANE